MPPTKDPIKYREAHEVEKVARDLIYDYHTHLATARIKYVFRSEPAEEKGKLVWGKARKMGGLNAWLASTGIDRGYEQSEPLPFFVIEIAEPIWNAIDDKTRRALVDHELTHCDVDIDTSKYSLRPHDLEEFGSIVRKHGLWRDDVELFVKAALEAGKYKLPLFDEDHPGKSVDEAIADEINQVRAQLGEQVLDSVADQVNAGALGSNVTAIKSKRSR